MVNPVKMSTQPRHVSKKILRVDLYSSVKYLVATLTDKGIDLDACMFHLVPHSDHRIAIDVFEHRPETQEEISDRLACAVRSIKLGNTFERELYEMYEMLAKKYGAKND